MRKSPAEALKPGRAQADLRTLSTVRTACAKSTSYTVPFVGVAIAILRTLRGAALRGENLGNYIGRELVLDVGNAVAQIELPFLQPLNLELVGPGRVLQGRNRRVEVAVLLLQARQLVLQLPFFLFCHFYQGLKRPRPGSRNGSPWGHCRSRDGQAAGLIKAGIGALHNENRLRKPPAKV